MIRYRWIDIIKGLKDKNADFVDKKVHFGRHTQFKKLFLIAFEKFRFIKLAKKLTVKILQNLLSLSIEVKRNSMKI